MTLKSNGNFGMKQDIKVDGNGYFGPAYIGKYGKTRSDWAQFSHVKADRYKSICCSTPSRRYFK